MTIKQRIHNLFYGENSREANRHFHYGVMTSEEWVTSVSALAHPDTSRIWGIDISHWDGNVFLSITKSKGATFVFIKGLDGTVRTRYFPENRARAITAGLLHAPYAWLYADKNVPAKLQAQELTRMLGEYPSDLPVVIDFEWTKYAGVYSSPNYTDLDKWATEYLALGNRKPILYSAAGFMNGLGKIPDVLKKKFAAIWIANYGVISPSLPFGYLGWDFWQFASSGDAKIYAPNDSGKLECDLNYWKGDLAELYQFAGITPENGEPMTTRYEATSEFNMSLRPQPNVDNSPVGTVLADSKMHGDELYETTGEKWLKVIDINGAPVRDKNSNVIAFAWVAIVHKNSVYSQLIDGGPVPQPEPMFPDLPYTITLGDGVTYEQATITGVLKPK